MKYDPYLQITDILTNLDKIKIEKKSMYFNFESLVEVPDTYKSYLYLVLFSHGKIMDRYLGYHDGIFDGTYKGSVTKHEEKFLEDLQKYDYRVFALAYGKSKDMIFLEKRMLDFVDARINEKYYNETKGGGAKLKNYTSGIKYIKDKIENVGTSDGYSVTREPKEEIEKMRAFQPRLLRELVGHVRDIRNHVKDSDGAWLEKNHRGVIVFEDFDAPGEDVRIGSYHTVKAVKPLKFPKKIKVIRVPKKDWSKMEDIDLGTKEIGMWDNPRKQDISISTEKDEFISLMVDICQKNGVNQDHQSITEKIYDQGYIPRERAGLARSIKKELANREERIQLNKTN